MRVSFCSMECVKEGVYCMVDRPKLKVSGAVLHRNLFYKVQWTLFLKVRSSSMVHLIEICFMMFKRPTYQH